MNKQQLASKIWKAANEMRSKIEANEYKDYILGLMFYKFLSDKEKKTLIEKYKMTQEELENANEEDQSAKKYVQEKLGYFIAYENLFSTWLKMGNDFTVANVSDALNAFERLIYEPDIQNGNTIKKIADTKKYSVIFSKHFKMVFLI